jgi:hypothetical protein
MDGQVAAQILFFAAIGLLIRRRSGRLAFIGNIWP